MTKEVFSVLKAHFKTAASLLKSEAEAAGLLNNPTDKGTVRESVYLDFLERHLPASCDIFHGGYLFDMNGNTSKQTDIIVTNGPTPRFRLGSGIKYIAPLEGTIAVAEVKSQLDQEQLRKSFDAFASMPQMPLKDGIVSPNLNIDDYGWHDTPYKILFAYGGISEQSVMACINDYYTINRDIPVTHRPNIIHVLGKCLIARRTREMNLTNVADPMGAEPQYGTFCTISSEPDISALVLLLFAIQEKAFLTQHVKFNYNNLVNEVSKRAVAEEYT